ncbi:amino acid permease [Paludisphaera sp.]|uniref:APC family permease n=1 Tax=Paludisphaera sp. TaxID=2017432 RepID=UPI00301D2C23
MSTESAASASRPDRVVLPRVLGPLTALSVVVGSVIGSGIFIVPARVAHELPFLAGILAVWVLAGAFTTAGALTLAELAAMLPQAGGPYVYLREAYGRLPAFLFGWSELTVSRAGSMATLAAAFARYFAQVFPAPEAIGAAGWQAIAACSAIGIVTAVNVMGTRGGGGLQVVGTALKVGGVLALIALPFAVGGGSTENFSPWLLSDGHAGGLFAGAMVAMVGVLWAYDGWMSVTPLAEEIREPGRNIPRALILGMSILVAIYLAMTLAYHYVLPMDAVAAAHNASGSNIANAVAAVYCKALLGAGGVLAISALVMCSTFISLNGNTLTGPRSYFAMARDGLLPEWFVRIHPRYQTPANAILSQAIWAVGLTVAGTVLILVPPPTSSTWLPGFVTTAWTALNKKHLYDLLLDYVMFGATVFYMLAVTSVFVLRRKRSDAPRPYRTLGYPFTPLLFVAASILLLGSMLAAPETRMQALGGGVLILLGVPAYYLLRRDGETGADAETSATE